MRIRRRWLVGGGVAVCALAALWLLSPSGIRDNVDYLSGSEPDSGRGSASQDVSFDRQSAAPDPKIDREKPGSAAEHESADMPPRPDEVSVEAEIEARLEKARSLISSTLVKDRIAGVLEFDNSQQMAAAADRLSVVREAILSIATTAPEQAVRARAYDALLRWPFCQSDYHVVIDAIQSEPSDEVVYDVVRQVTRRFRSAELTMVLASEEGRSSSSEGKERLLGFYDRFAEYVDDAAARFPEEVKRHTMNRRAVELRETRDRIAGFASGD